MTTTTTPTPLLEQAFTGTLRPRQFADFDSPWADRNRHDNWTTGALEYVCDVLGPDQPCLIEVDKSTGFTVLGYLRGVRPCGSQSRGLAVYLHHPTDERQPGHTVVHYLWNIGTIVPLPAPGKTAPGHHEVWHRMDQDRQAARALLADKVPAEWYGRTPMACDGLRRWTLHYRTYPATQGLPVGRERGTDSHWSVTL
jgi:hypothetical protein